MIESSRSEVRGEPAVGPAPRATDGGSDPAEAEYQPHVPGRRQGAGAKNWLMTINNYVQSDLDAFQANVALLVCACYGKEVGENGTPHLQCYLSFAKKTRPSAITKIWPRSWHAIARATPWMNWLYCAKGEQSKVEWKAMREQGPNYGKNAQFITFGKKPTKPNVSPYHEAFRLLDSGATVQQAIDLIVKECPRDIALHGQQIRKNFVDRKREPFEHIFVSTDFVRPLEILDKHLLIWGPSGLGKSQYAYAHFGNPLVVPGSDLERIRHLTPDHDGIVFDDCDLRHIFPNKVIGILGRDNTPRAFPCRYANVSIPTTIFYIFTFNEDNPFYDDVCRLSQSVAIDSRIRRVHITESLFVAQQ